MSDGPLQSLINGQQAEHISIRDRGFQYGDGCFETIRIISNTPVLWSEHWERLRRACKTLGLTVDFNLLQTEVELLLQNTAEPDAILKIIVTRGESGRGYTPVEQSDCTRVVQLSPYDAADVGRGARVALCQHRLSSNSNLAGIKHLNRLDQVLASAQIPASHDEGLCMDEHGAIIEGCRSNLLFVIESQLLTPALDRCGVEGVMLNYIISEFQKLGTEVVRSSIDLEKLQRAEAILLCNSVFGVWPVAEIDDAGWQAATNDNYFTAAALSIRNSLLCGSKR